MLSYFRDVGDIAVFCDEQILLAQDAKTGLWEFPGGKVFDSTPGKSYDPFKSDAESQFEEHLGLRGYDKETHRPDWFFVKTFDRVETETPNLIHVTYLRKTNYHSCSKWDIDVDKYPYDYDDEEEERDEDWEPKYRDWGWFPVYELPNPLHPRVDYVRELRPELFANPHADPNYISQATWYDQFILPKGTTVWHGAHKTKAETVLEAGHLSGNTWTPEDHSHKTSGGTLEEAGLLWVFVNLSPTETLRGEAIQGARSYADGTEARRWCRTCRDPKSADPRCGECAGTSYSLIPEPGKIFEAILPKDMRIAHRSKTLTAQEAEILDLALDDSYFRIKPGTALRTAVNTFYDQRRRVGFAYILPLLGYDGIAYGDHSIAILTNRLDYRRVFRRFL